MITRNRVVYLVTAVLLLCGCGASAVGQPPASTQPVAAHAPCDNAYMPVKAGAKWTYSGSNNVTTSYTQVTTITNVGTDSFTLSVDTGTGVTWTETWTCTKDGLLQLQNDGGPLAAAASGPDGKATVKTKSNTGITIPTDLKPGDTWSQATESVISGSGVSVTVKSTSTFKAVGSESVTVAAGTFEATRIDETVDSTSTFGDGKSMSGTGKVTSWWVRGKGLVKAISTAFSVTSEVDLKSYQVP